MEEFHHLGTHAHLKLLLDERIGHRIVVAVDFHMIINVDTGQCPLGICIGLDRQGPIVSGTILAKGISGEGDIR
jgi:hypothetical protein